MPPLKDLTGLKFGRLTVLRKDKSTHNNVCWLCMCDCGKQKVIPGNVLLLGRTKSCGCLRSERAINQISKNRTHGMSGTRVYVIWRGMLSRCGNPKNSKFSFYGGRGIKVCERWKTFENFYTDMGDPADDSLSIDRINNNGDYEPGNCRWATREEQHANRSDSRLIEVNGEVKTATEWSRALGISYRQIIKRFPTVERSEFLSLC